MPPSQGVPPHFVVIVPGYMGSKLRRRDTRQTVWIDFSTIPPNPLRWDDWLADFLQQMAYPNDNLEPAGIVDEVVFVPPWAKQEQYGRLLAALEMMGYRVDEDRYPEEQRDVYCFSYDWRQDNRLSGRQLLQAIERWRGFHNGAKAWLIAHSNGGIISRWAIEREGGAGAVDRLFLMASPWDGAPKGMRVLFGGLEFLFRRGFDPFGIAARTRELVRSFPSAYQLLPTANPFLRSMDNQTVDLFGETKWLDSEPERQRLADGQAFNRELARDLSVETLCFFGRKIPTNTYGILSRSASDGWDSIEWRSTEAGDGTVPETSAVHPAATARLPFVATHGDIYVNPAVLEFLKWEMQDKFRAPAGTSLAQAAPALAATLDGPRVTLTQERDSYEPGNAVPLAVTAEDSRDGEPVTAAQVTAEFVWRGPLPGSPAAPPAAPPAPRATLAEAEPGSGRYAAVLQAPEAEGYYTVRLRVGGHELPVMRSEELIAIEKTG